MKALVGTFNQEKALVGAFSVLVQPVVEPMEHYTALVWVDEQQGAAREGRGRKQRGSGGVQEKNDDCGCGDCLTAQSPVSVLTNCPLARHVSNVWNGEYHALLPNSLGDGVYRCLCPRNQSG